MKVKLNLERDFSHFKTSTCQKKKQTDILKALNLDLLQQHVGF